MKNKLNLSLDLDDAYDGDDFGFSAVSEEELRERETLLQQQVNAQSKELEAIEESYKGKLEQLYKAIMPLLLNLAKDDNKEYIFWPDRTKKMKEFIERVKRIVND